MRASFSWVWFASVALTVACSGAATDAGNGSTDAAVPAAKVAIAAKPAAPKAGLACADDGDRLPITGLCASRAVNYLNVTDGKPPEAMEGCEWVVQETPFANDVLLYRALRCGDKTTKLAFAGGAGLAELSYETGAWGDPDNQVKGQVLVRVGSADRGNPTGSVSAIAREAISDPAEKARCSVRKANMEFWPADALVVDISAAEAAKEEEPRGGACGPFGYQGDASAFWRVFQGFSWFFELGQDPWQIDPGSFTLISKDDKGEWGQVE